MPKKNQSTELAAVDVYLERRKSRDYVGKLLRTTDARNGYEFEYNDAYLLRKNSIPLGPEFPLSRKRFQSKKMFQSFDDRIPSRDNPAYADYCKAAGISPGEVDPLVLVSTVGRRGPSSFVFEPNWGQPIVATDLASFRKDLGLAIREFAAAFGTSPSSIQMLEAGKEGGKEVVKRLEIYILFPEVALHEIKKNRASLHSKVYQQASTRLESRLRARQSETQT